MSAWGRARATFLAPWEWGGLAVSLVAAGVLLTRYSLNGALSRDEALYAYAGERLANGVPPYASVFDPKGPGATFVAGAAAAVAHAFGRNELYAMRIAFFLLCVATAGAIYLLALRLFGSVLAGVTAAVVLSSFQGWAADALAGPDAKTPGIFLSVVAMLLMANRRWAWAAAAGSMAFLVWQPLFVYPAMAVLLAVVQGSPRGRLRAFAAAAVGAVLPVLATVVYFAWAGALGKLVEAALVFPLTGIRHQPETLGGRARLIVSVVDQWYRVGPAAITFWLGAGALLVLVGARLVRRPQGWTAALGDPLVCVVATTWLGVTAYALFDFQGYPDVYPLLAYPALGLAGVVAAALRVSPARAWRVPAGAVTAALLLALVVGASTQFVHDTVLNNRALRNELSAACGVQRLLRPGERVWALGDPTVLVLTHRANPDRFVYLESGVDAWKIHHTPGGFAGWRRQVRAVDPAVIVRHGWHTPTEHRMADWLRQRAGYVDRHLGGWQVFVTPRTEALARSSGVWLTRWPTPVALAPDGRRLPGYACRILG